MTVAPLYLSFIGNKREVKIRTLISFERPCYLKWTLEKTKEIQPGQPNKTQAFFPRKILHEHLICYLTPKEREKNIGMIEIII